MRVKKINANDYLYASARVRMLGNKIVSKGKLHQMIDARSLRQAFRVLNESGIGLNDTPENYENALISELSETYGLIQEITKNHPIFDIFRYGYDGLNIKIIIKSRAASGMDPLRAMTPLGTIPPRELMDGINKRNYKKLPREMAYAAEMARRMPAHATDPQAADIAVDKAMLSAMHRVAHMYNNAFIKKWVRSKIDIENIRSLVRIKRAGKDTAFLCSVLSPGGYIENEKWAGAFSGSHGMREIAAFIRNTQYGPALEKAFDEMESSGRLTPFEKYCDNFLLTFIGEANRFVFGIEPIAGYILEKENEITSVRMVMASKMANIPADTIIERLREYAW